MMLDPAREPTVLQMCVLNISSGQEFGAELTHPHLIPHPHRDHNSVPYALQDVWPGLKTWAVAAKQSNTEWPHTGSEALTTSPQLCLQTTQAKWKLPLCLCTSNMFQRKSLTTGSHQLLRKEFFTSRTAPCLRRAAKWTTVGGIADGNFMLQSRTVVTTETLSSTKVK